ncbi:MAG: hypothetical protein ACFB4I_22580 [Cyanophyceae cyanobacterium]
MTNEFLSGAWTYRSYNNITEPVSDDCDKLKNLIFGEGEMVFEAAAEPGTIRGQLAFRSDPPKMNDARLSLQGSLQTGNPFSLRFQGTGVLGTFAQGWVYDYVAYFVPEWPNGKNQRPALVGTVIRTVEHGEDSPAGVVASFVAVQRDFPEPRTVIPLPQEVLKMLASKHHRLHHTVWHSVRGLWLNPMINEEKKQAIRELGWQPGGEEERPSVDATGAPLIRNGSGEDFLFMHRQMIQEVNRKIKEAGQEPIAGWPTIPRPGSVGAEPDYEEDPPVLPTPGNPDGFAIPPAWIDPTDEITNRRIALLKTDGHYWSRMAWWDREFKNKQYLSTLSLGELGALLEYSVHNDMHMRWTSAPYHPALGVLPSGREDNDIRDFWDRPEYDFLGEFYSSHVNPVFWRLHGWVDDRINDWFSAHEAAHPGEVVKTVIQGVDWFEKGQWVHTDSPWAGPSHEHEHGEHHYDVEKMKKVVGILYGPSPEDTSEKALVEALQKRSAERQQRQPRHLTWF